MEHIDLDESDLFEPGGSYDNTATHILHAIDSPNVSLGDREGQIRDSQDIGIGDLDDSLDIDLDDEGFCYQGKDGMSPSKSIPISSLSSSYQARVSIGDVDRKNGEDEFEIAENTIGIGVSSKSRGKIFSAQEWKQTKLMDTSLGVAASVPVRPSPIAMAYAGSIPPAIPKSTSTQKAANVGSSFHQLYSNEASIKRGFETSGSHLVPLKSSSGTSFTHREVDNEVEDLSSSSASVLGTSMPIRIPMLQRKSVSGTPPISADGRSQPFVPPHLLEEVDETTTLGMGSPALSMFSPPGAIKREKLMARNAILRSTGFIEVKPFGAPVSETIDVVKESVMPNIPIQRGKASTSSLSLALGTSK